MVTIIRDDTIANISTSGGIWERFYGGSAMSPPLASNARGDTCSLTMAFQGVYSVNVGHRL